jgi:signal transduction histidine kinase
MTRSPWSREFRLIDVDGTLRWILGNSVITGEDGDRLIWTGTFIDVTERKDAEEVLRQVNRQLNLMTSITRHDVLNKIVAAEGYIELASRRADGETRAMLSKARRSVDAMRSEIELTRDLQDLSSHRPEWQDMDEMLRELKQAPEICTTGSCHRLEVYANHMLKKVFLNLIDNTVRHGGHANNVRIECRSDGMDMIISYADDGVGVPLKE